MAYKYYIPVTEASISYRRKIGSNIFEFNCNGIWRKSSAHRENARAVNQLKKALKRVALKETIEFIS